MVLPEVQEPVPPRDSVSSAVAGTHLGVGHAVAVAVAQRKRAAAARAAAGGVEDSHVDVAGGRHHHLTRAPDVIGEYCRAETFREGDLLVPPRARRGGRALVMVTISVVAVARDQQRGEW